MTERTAGHGRLRLLAVYTHPIQYYAPLFRTLSTTHPEIDLEVLYITRPTAEQQGQGFGIPFQWDQDLTAGYRWRLYRHAQPGDDYTRWSGLDAPGIAAAIEDSRPDVVLLPGWNCRGLVRTLLACNRLGIPVLYRGDTSLWQDPGGLWGMAWSLKNRLLLRRFSGYAAVGRRARTFLREHAVPDESIIDSPHAVDAHRIQRDAGDALTPAGRAHVRAELGFRSSDFVVLFSGKLEPKKRPQDAVRAVAELGEGATLAVCGAGILEGACRKAAADVGARVAWLGFQNQAELPRIYAAADVLLLPSGWGETWGLVVNEAMAVGTPCIVSDAVGCAPDLVRPGHTGEVYPAGAIPFLVEALRRIRDLSAGPARLLSLDVQAQQQRCSLESAASGIACLAANVVGGGSPAAPAPPRSSILSLCDGMVILGGMERRTMEILDYAADGGAKVHCVFEHRPWRHYRLSHRAEQSGHSWSTTRVTTGLFTCERSVRWALGVLGDVLLSSGRVFLTAIRRRPNIVFLASFASALRNWPALLALRWMGFTIVLRSGNAPAPEARHRRIWRLLVDSVVDSHVANSQFIASEIVATGIFPGKVRTIRNPLPYGDAPPSRAHKVENRIIYVGQVLPEKGIIELLDALSLLQSRGIPFDALFVGRFHGWEHPIHQGHKAAVGAKIAALAAAVRILGEREDILELMASASIHCCPSHQREGLANVVLQAKVAGIPSVVTPSGALPEMVRHGVDGWICRGFDPEAIAEGLAHFLLDTDACRRAGVEAARWRDPDYLRETVAGRWKDLLCGPPASNGR